MSDLRISRDLALPLDVAGEAIAILAKRGSGKTNTGIVLAEEMYAAGVQFVVLDPVSAWYGLRSKLEVPIIGGAHGDLELSPTAGALLADVVMDTGQSLVLDTSNFATKAEVARFVRDFLDHLYRRLAREPRLIHVFLEEADEFAPQKPFKDETRMLSAVEQAVRRGRGRGLGITLITQRSAVLNKNVLEQTDVLVAMRTTGPNDRKAIEGWVGRQANGDDHGVIESLPRLETGEAWIWNPERELLNRVKIRARKTLDVSGRLRAGEQRVDVEMKPIDLARLGARIQETAEKQKENDPAELRKRIRQLENEIAKKPKVEEGFVAWANDRIRELEANEPERVEVSALTDQDRYAMAKFEALGEVALGQWRQDADRLEQLLIRIETLLRESERGPTEPPQPRQPRPAARKPHPAAPEPRGGGDSEEHLKAGARRILETFARHYPMRMTRAQLGTLARFKITGGTFQTYWSQLKRLGYVVEQGDECWITEAGLDYVGHVAQEPMSTEEIIEQWRGALKAGARRMLDILVALDGGEISKDDLAARLDMAVSGGTFQTYLSTLRRNGLAEIDGQFVRAGEALFIGAAA